MKKSLLLKKNIYNLANQKVWSIDYAEYQAISWNEKGILTEEDFNELIEKLEELREEQAVVEEVETVEEISEENEEEE